MLFLYQSIALILIQNYARYVDVRIYIIKFPSNKNWLEDENVYLMMTKQLLMCTSVEDCLLLFNVEAKTILTGCAKMQMRQIHFRMVSHKIINLFYGMIAMGMHTINCSIAHVHLLHNVLSNATIAIFSILCE